VSVDFRAYKRYLRPCKFRLFIVLSFSGVSAKFMAYIIVLPLLDVHLYICDLYISDLYIMVNLYI
jgi:hypothetical protein